MDLAVPHELEELILCSCCHLPFNDTDSLPKLFTCRHYFCLKCANTTLQKGSELYCVHCWKRTELSGPDMTPDNLPTYGAILYLTQNLNVLCANTKSSSGKQRSSSTSSINSNNGGNSCGASGNSTASGSSNSISETTIVQTNIIQKGENCMTHAMPNTSWCANCIMLVCRACAASEDHRNHVVKSHVEVNETIQADIANELHSMQKTLNDVQYLVVKQREFLLKILESCTTMKTQIETELLNQLNNKEISDMRESLCRTRICLDMFERQSPTELLKLYTTLHMEKQRLNSRYEEIYLQCKLDDLIRNYGMVFDFDIIKQALNQIHNCVYNGGNLDAFAGLNGTATHHSPILLLANYCISQLYTRHVVAVKQQYQSIFSSNTSGYYQLQQHLLQLSHNQQQAIVPPQASLSSQSSPHDGVIQVKTYADITTMSPKSNQQLHHPSNNPTSNNGFGNRLTDTSGSGGNGMGPVAPPSGVRIPPPPPGTFTSNDFNSLNVPALNMIQHIHKKQHSNQVQKSNGQQQQGNSAANLLCNPSVHVYPIYYFNIDMNGQNIGRILIEVRNDVAPKMAKNFGALVTHELGFGYKGCQIFQCWENESIITGDFELNNGRGGRSVFEENYFMPDDTKILAIRGSVGMRRSQKRHDNMGLVGSQFRVILREMRGFTGIFAFVVDGLDLVEKISQAGDSAGKPQSNVVILNCGKYQ